MSDGERRIKKDLSYKMVEMFLFCFSNWLWIFSKETHITTHTHIYISFYLENAVLVSMLLFPVPLLVDNMPNFW